MRRPYGQPARAGLGTGARPARQPAVAVVNFVQIEPGTHLGNALFALGVRVGGLELVWEA